jgi:ZIP family zinc transporter
MWGLVSYLHSGDAHSHGSSTEINEEHHDEEVHADEEDHAHEGEHHDEEVHTE